MEEQTPSARIVGDRPVVVEVLDPSSLGEMEARVVDVSRTSLRLILRVQIPRDAYLLVKLKNYLLFGEVGYCCSSSGAYDVGLLIEESLCLLPLESGPTTLIDIVREERVH